jgi:hypothetical protein
VLCAAEKEFVSPVTLTDRRRPLAAIRHFALLLHLTPDVPFAEHGPGLAVEFVTTATEFP